MSKGMGGREFWAAVVVTAVLVGASAGEAKSQEFQRLTIGRVESGTIEGSADIGLWRFDGVGGHVVSIAAMSEDIDTVVELWSVQDGERIARDDDGGLGTDSALVVVLPMFGEYEVRVTSFGWGIGRYRVVVQTATVIESEVNGTESSGVLGGGGTRMGVWRFDGRAGEVVRVTASSGAFDTVLELRSPEGQEIAWDDDGGPGTDSELVATLLTSGHHMVRVTAFGEGAGSYDLGVSTVAEPPTKDSGVWDFTGRAGEVVVVTAGSSTFDTTVELRSAVGESLGRDSDGGPGTDSRLIRTLPDDGQYQVWVSASDGGEGPYDVAVGRVVVAFLEMDVPVDGELGVDGGVWRFDGEADQRVVLTAGSESFDTVLELGSSEGETLGRDDDGGPGADSRLVATLPRDGEYRVWVRALYGDDTGGYTVTLAKDVPSLAEDVSSSVLAMGAAVDGELGVDGGVWRFDGEADQRVVLTAGSESFDTVLELGSSEGETLGRDDDGGPGTDSRLVATLPRDGEYRVWVTSFGNDTGGYTVTLAEDVSSLGADVSSSVLIVGAAVVGDLGVDGGAWRFGGEAGQRVVLTARSESFRTVLELRSSDGELLGRDDDRGPGTGSRLVATLPRDGEYRVSVTTAAYADDTGGYTVTLAEDLSSSVLTMGAAIDGDLGTDAGVWRFYGEVGQTVVVTAGSDAFDTVLELRSPESEGLGWDDDGGPGTDSRLVSTLPRDGEYRVWVTSFGDDTGGYTVALAADVSSSVLTMGAAVDGDLGVDGGVWRFYGEVGQTVVVTAGSDAFDTVLELRSPDGEELGRDDDGGPGTDSRLVATLPRDEEYRVWVTSFGNDTGGYTVALAEDVSSSVLTMGAAVDGDLGVDGGVWRFYGEVGQTVVVTAGSGVFDTVLELQSPEGEELGRDDDGGRGTDSRLVATLPRDGEYRVWVTSFGDDTGGYTVALAEDVSSSVLTMGAAVDGDLGVDGGVWRFYGEVGQTVVVTAGSDAFDTVLELRSPDGEELGRDDDGGPGTDSRLVATLPRDEEYRVWVTSFGNDTGGYTVTLTEDVSSTVLTMGAAVDGDLGADGGAWRFYGEVGQTVVVTAGSDAFDTVLELRSPDGEELGRDDDGGLGTDDSRLVATLPRDGEYRVWVTASDYGFGSYTVSVRAAVLRRLEVNVAARGAL